LKKVVLILSDAFRHDYLDRGLTPFLNEAKERGQYVRQIIPGNGFCERAEIFTGRPSTETGFFTAIDLSQEKSIYSTLNPFLIILDLIIKIIKSPLLEKIIRRLIWEVISRTKRPMHPYKIPLKFLKYFTLTEDKIDMREKGALGFPSIFDLITERGGDYFYDSFTALNIAQKGNDQSRLNQALLNATKDYSHYFIYISLLDSTGHKFGPKSKEIDEAIKNVDLEIDSFIKEFELKCPDTNFIILGDHGMLKVEQSIDALSLISKTMAAYPISYGRDYFYFLDSTLVRVWIRNEEFKGRITADLEACEEFKMKGKFISIKNSKEYEIPINDKSPDFIWWANPGVLVSPDFFHKKDEKIQGMHGYINSSEQSRGFCISIGPDIKPSAVREDHLTSVFKKLQGDFN